MDKHTADIAQEVLTKLYEEVDAKLDTNYKVTRKYLLDNMDRATKVIKSFLILNKHNIDNVLEHTIGILLRSALNDFIIFSYYRNTSMVDGIVNLDMLDEGLFNQVFNHLVRDKKGREIKDFIEQDEIKDFLNNFSNGYKYTLKDLRCIAKEARKSAREANDVNLREAVDSWEWYSKYEHYGCVTTLVANHDENIKRQNVCIYYIMANIFNSLITIKLMGCDSINFDSLCKELNLMFDKYVEAIGLKFTLT